MYYSLSYADVQLKKETTHSPHLMIASQSRDRGGPDLQSEPK